MAPPKRNVDELITEVTKALDEAYENAEPGDRDTLLDSVQNHLSAKWDELTSDEDDTDNSGNVESEGEVEDEDEQ